jgi:hypothetical protein
MAKTLTHYSQQIKALAPDAVALDRAKQLGDLLVSAKAAVKAAGKSWTAWLETDCSLSSRTAQRFMTIATRWDDAAFTEARKHRPDLPLREADKVLAANSTRKKVPAKRTREQQLWDAAFNDRIAYDGWICTCGNHLRAQKGAIPHCAGTTHRPHDVRPMVCEVQDGFLMRFGDLGSYSTAPQLVAIAKQLRTQLPEATYFTTSSAGHSVRVSNALDPAALQPISLDIRDDNEPSSAWIGGLDDNLICTPAEVARNGKWQQYEATAALVVKALGWELV